MDIFTALADNTRRQIVEMLASKGRLSASQISDKFTVSPPAISQHLKVLLQAKLVEVEKRSQQRLYQINPGKITELELWVRKMKKVWEDKFDRMEQILAEEKKINLKKGVKNNG